MAKGNAKMKIASRAYDPEDFTFVMRFLYETFKETNTYQNWFPDRFENCLIGREDVSQTGDIRIWEKIDDATFSKRIVALANPEAPTDYFIQINPAYSFLEREIIQWIEKHCLENKNKHKKEKLNIHTIEGNSARELLLTNLGYQRGERYGYLRLRSPHPPAHKFDCPEGYKIRSVKGTSEYAQLAAVTRLVFGHGEWFNAEIIKEIASCSFYKQNLDLVAIAPNGSIASFCTFRMDPLSKITSLEPMGTHPDYRGRGLAKALIYEGLNRAMKYKPVLFYIGGAADNPAANRLYDSVGFTKKLAEYCWHKKI
jgi:ribosomal protein S18 acetylase RimI-like enzyme